MEFDFGQAYETAEAVPEKYRGLFSEAAEGDNAGKFVLNPAATGLVADFTGLQKSAAGLRQEKSKAGDEAAQRRLAIKNIEEALTGLGVEIGEEGVVPAVEAYIGQLQESAKSGQAVKVDLEKLKGQFQDQVKQLTEEHEADKQGMRNALHSHMVKGDAALALAQHKGSVELLMPHILNQAELTQDEDKKWVVRIKDGADGHRLAADGSYLGISGLVAEMKTQDAFARAFESETPAGTGSPPGGLSRPSAMQQPGEEKTAIQKIGAGLAKAQGRRYGAGA